MKTIRGKIMLAMLALVFVVIILLTDTFVWFFTKSSAANLAANNQLLAKEASLNFDYMVDSYVKSVSQLVTSESFTNSADNSDRITQFTDRYYSDTMYTSFGIYSSDGKLLESSSSGCADVITDSDVASASARYDAAVTKLVEIDGKYYFGVLMPIPLSAGSSEKQVAAAVICCDNISQSLNTLSDKTSNSAYVLSRDGQVIFTAGETYAEVGQKPIELANTDESYKGIADTFKTAINGKSGSYEYKLDHKRYTAGFYPVSHFNVMIVVSTPTSVGVFDVSTGSIWIIGVFLVVLIILTIIFALLFARRISKPIVASTNRLRALSNGDISSRVDVVYSSDELGVLSNSLEETVINLRQYINLIQIALQQIAEGNLSHRMDGNFKGDFKKIKDTFNEIFESLNVTFDSINNSAEQVTSGAVMVSNSAQALSQGATEQASAIEELSATLSGVSDQVIQNSDSAMNAYKIVNDNTDAMNRCNEDMRNMLDAMKMITETSEEIQTILKVIDDISFQTNILALNAAVEAAREGSKGFGVVADEVRQLAARSAEAAKQTAALIKRSSSAVANGTSIAETTAKSLDSLAKDSERISELIKNIADASAEQSEAIMQINTGVDQISAVVSANTASAVGSASASEELSSQSLILKNMIARFRLSSDEPQKTSFIDEDDDDIIPSSPEESAPPQDEDDGLDLAKIKVEEMLNAIDDDDEKY